VNPKSDSITLTVAPVALTSITLSASLQTIGISGLASTSQITVSKTPSQWVGDFTYTSNDPNIATVSSSGLVTGVAAGTATITVASVGNPTEITNTIQITVENKNYATDLFISEVYEGASNNKYVEIFNGTGAAIDLQNYSIRTCTNGALFTTTHFRLSPSSTPLMLAHNNTVVVYNNSTDSVLFPLLKSTDGSYTTGIKINAGGVNAVGFNGDDAVGLFKTTDGINFNLIDIMGISGEGDPGTTFANLKTDDTSVQRISSVRSPFITTIGSPTPTSYRWDFNQWTSTAINTTTNSGGGTPGSHSMNF
jgi:hypothetical protein